MYTILFTKEGYENLKAEQAKLVTSRKDAVIDLSKARAMGDLSENGYYRAAKFKLSDIDRTLRHLKRLIKDGKISTPTHHETVGFGTSVTIHDGKKNQTYMIVGEYEANPSLGKISHVSPLGKSLMGKKPKEIASFQSPSGTSQFTIVSIL